MGPGSFDPGNGLSGIGDDNGEPASMGPGSFDPGNRPDDLQAFHQHLASMGPGSFDPGNWLSARLRRPTTRRLQWGRGLSTPEIDRPPGHGTTMRPGFNGAGVFRPRKCTAPLGASAQYPRLQWGRGLSTPEIKKIDLAQKLFNDASMGPGSFDPGNVKVSRDAIESEQASMGPGSFDPGNRPPSTWRWRTITLQWGRGLSTPEMQRAAYPAAVATAASMGPGSFDPGNLLTETRIWHRPPSFNGAGVFRPRK